MADRLDLLLEEALATGTVPPGVSDAERAEIEAALRAAGLLRASSPAARGEADATVPTARARFERFIAAEQASARAARLPVAAPRRGLLGRWFGRPRLLAFGGVAAVLLVVAAAALFAPRFDGGGGIETASAQVLAPGDYAQVEGVVEEVTGEGEAYEVVLRTYHASIRVAVSAATVRDDAGGAPLRAGDAILVGGVVQDDLSLAASSVMPGAVTGDVPAGEAEPPRLLASQAGDGLRGHVLTFALTRDGAAARVLLQLEDGRRVLAWVDPVSAERLLLRAAAVGADVIVRPGSGARDVFTLELAGANGSGDPGRASPLRFTGVITGRVANVLIVETTRGDARVTLLPRTIILPGDSGLDRAAIRDGESVTGHRVVIAGSLGPRGQTILADVVVLGATAAP